MEWWDPAAITTVDGALEITLSEKDTHGLAYEGGMMSTWNKFCFTGGLVETSVTLPGSNNVAGLWPAIWVLGNLGWTNDWKFYFWTNNNQVEQDTVQVSREWYKHDHIYTHDFLISCHHSGHTHMMLATSAQLPIKLTMGDLLPRPLTVTNFMVGPYHTFRVKDFQDALAPGNLTLGLSTRTVHLSVVQPPR